MDRIGWNPHITALGADCGGEGPIPASRRFCPREEHLRITRIVTFAQNGDSWPFAGTLCATRKGEESWLFRVRGEEESRVIPGCGVNTGGERGWTTLPWCTLLYPALVHHPVLLPYYTPRVHHHLLGTPSCSWDTSGQPWDTLGHLWEARNASLKQASLNPAKLIKVIKVVILRVQTLLSPRGARCTGITLWAQVRSRAWVGDSRERKPARVVTLPRGMSPAEDVTRGKRTDKDWIE